VARGLSPAQLAGQRVAFPFAGTEPPAALVARIRRGEAGAVILFGRNVAGRAGLRRLARRLQAIPRPPGLRAPLLVMVDQEGGPVRRVPGPPARGARELGAAPPAAARAAGRAAGRLLRGAGVNVDLAPVADVGRPGAALVGEGRVFGSDPAAVAARAGAFAAGLRDGRVAATAKHFPGLGAAGMNTDAAPVEIRLAAATLRRRDLVPFRALVERGVPAVMLATAVYPALDPARRPAALSPPIARDELRGRLGFTGVAMSDALDTPALAPYGDRGRVAVRAAGAGTDLLVYASGYAEADRAARALGRAIARGRLARAPAERAAARVLALRRRVG